MEHLTKNVAKMGVFTALAMIFSYIEVLFPFHFGIPGVKAGLANIVVVTALYLFDWKQVWLISISRILLMDLLFGNGMSVLYSLAGGCLSLLGMGLLYKTKKFSVMGVSVAGGVLHNVGQLIVAAFVVQNAAVFYYMAVLLLAGALTGFVIGLLCGRMIVRIKKM